MFTISGDGGRSRRGNKGLGEGLHHPLHPPTYHSRLPGYTHLKNKTKTTYTLYLTAHVRREDLAVGGRPPYQLSAWEPLCCSLTRVKTSA